MSTERTGVPPSAALQERMHDYLVRQLGTGRTPRVAGDSPPGPAITISHQTGAGALEIASRLAELLQAEEPPEAHRWTVFDRRLVETALEEHNLPKSLAKLIPEDRRSFLQDVMEELVGLRPPSWVVVPQIVETILHLAEVGHVILVGHGASMVTARMPKVFHVRLIGSLPNRIKRVQELYHLSPEEAAQRVAKEDRGRGRYVRAFFHSRLDDDLQYHLVVNTDRIPDAARLIAQGARDCFRREAGQP